MGDYMGGAPGGTRTPTPLRVPDFESGASTGSATGARYMFKLSGRVCQQSAHRFRRPPTSFHEVGTVAKTDCKAKAVAQRRVRTFPNAQGWHRRGRYCTNVPCDRTVYLRGLLAKRRWGSGRSRQGGDGPPASTERAPILQASRGHAAIGRSACNTPLRLRSL